MSVFECYAQLHWVQDCVAHQPQNVKLIVEILLKKFILFLVYTKILHKFLVWGFFRHPAQKIFSDAINVFSGRSKKNFLGATDLYLIFKIFSARAAWMCNRHLQSNIRGALVEWFCMSLWFLFNQRIKSCFTSEIFIKTLGSCSIACLSQPLFFSRLKCIVQ